MPLNAGRRLRSPNLIRCEPSGVCDARIRVRGKLTRRSLNTTVLSVAKLRLGDFEKSHRQAAEGQTEARRGNMPFSDAPQTLRSRIEGDATLQPRSRSYYEQRMDALTRNWPELEPKDVRALTRTDCLPWAARFARQTCATAFNHTVGGLRRALDIVVELGLRYDNPAAAVKRVRVRPTPLTLPGFSQFAQFVADLQSAGGRDSRNCADPVRLLVFGGFRPGEARHITWADGDFAKGEITVRGEAANGTKNSELRTVPMIPERMTLWQRLRHERPQEAPSTHVMQVKECQKAMDRAAKCVDMSRITHHDLRHRFATRCIESGVDIPTVSRWLGHKDGGALAMKTYGHLRDEHSSNMAKKVTFGAASAAQRGERAHGAASVATSSSLESLRQT